MRRIILNTAVYLVRHARLAPQRVESLTALERNVVTKPLRAVNAQDCAKDKLCVRLSSTRLTQLACVGVCTITILG